MADLNDTASAAQTGAGAPKSSGTSVQASSAGAAPANAASGTGATGASAQTASVYSVDDLVRAARQVFGTAPECVRVALRRDGKASYTAGAAKTIVGKFLKREVK